MYYSGRPGGRSGGRLGGRVGEMENKAISASNLKLKLKLTEAELGKRNPKNLVPLFFFGKKVMMTLPIAQYSISI